MTNNLLYLKAIGSNIKNLREEMGISQDELAKSLNVSKSAISTWETGTRNPSLTQLKKINALYHSKLAEIIEINAVDTEKVQSQFRLLQENFNEREMIELAKKILVQYM